MTSVRGAEILLWVDRGCGALLRWADEGVRPYAKLFAAYS